MFIYKASCFISKLEERVMLKKSQKAVQLSNAILWAVAIITSAMLGNSNFLTIIILPVLALMSISNSAYFTTKDSKNKQQTDDDDS
jgi:hypothetical protein